MVTPEEIARAMAVHSVDDEGSVQIDSDEAAVVVATDGVVRQVTDPPTPPAGAVGLEEIASED